MQLIRKMFVLHKFQKITDILEKLDILQNR